MSEPLSDPILLANWAHLAEVPTTINKVHQSCYRSAEILRCVLVLCNLGASPQIIKWFLDGACSLPQKEISL